MFDQTFELHDLVVVGLLIILEGVLSIDNALVLGLLAKPLPHHQQKRALTYGLVGAFVFRFIAIATAVYLMHWRIVKLLGGAYLVYISIKHFFFESKEHKDEAIALGEDGQPTLIDQATGQPLSPCDAAVEIRGRTPAPIPNAVLQPAYSPAVNGRKFWSIVAAIELTDIAFAIDSILAAIALVTTAPVLPGHWHPKLWVVITGGFLGVVLMRFAAVIFIRLLERFPRFETSAYLLVVVIGAKLLADWGFNAPPRGLDPTALAQWHGPLDFHTPANWAFWLFWSLMLICFCIGFIPQRRKG